MAKSDRYTYQNKMKHMVTDLRQQIKRGTYAQGEYLPSEMTLIELYGLSKNSVRQALDQLVQEELIVKVPRVGTQVVAASRQTRKIRFGLYPSLYAEAEMEYVLALFQERHPEVAVEIVDLPYEHPESIANLMRLGIVDVLSVNIQDMMHFQENGSTGLFHRQEPRASTYTFCTARSWMPKAGWRRSRSFILPCSWPTIKSICGKSASSSRTAVGAGTISSECCVS